MHRRSFLLGKLQSRLSTPARIALALLLFICIVEFTIMAALGRVSAALPWSAIMLIDTVVLTALVSLFVWFALIAPLRQAFDHERRRTGIVLDNLVEGIVTIDATGTIRAFNRAAERMFGYSAAEALGQNVRLIVPPPHKQQHDDYVQRYVTSGRSAIMNTRREVIAERRDGSTFPVEISLSEAVLQGERLLTAILIDITERRRLEEEIRRLAHHDPLTGLPNRALFLDRLAQSLALAHRHQHKVGLLFMDLDGFKSINDQFGHGEGDAVLRAFAFRLRGQVRDSDTVARFGGDEFTIIVPGILARGDAEEAAERVMSACAEPFAIGAQSALLGVSIGIAVYPEDALTRDDLLRVSDTRMYEAKLRQGAEHR